MNRYKYIDDIRETFVEVSKMNGSTSTITRPLSHLRVGQGLRLQNKEGEAELASCCTWARSYVVSKSTTPKVYAFSK